MQYFATGNTTHQQLVPLSRFTFFTLLSKHIPAMEKCECRLQLINVIVRNKNSKQKNQINSKSLIKLTKQGNFIHSLYVICKSKICVIYLCIYKLQTEKLSTFINNISKIKFKKIFNIVLSMINQKYLEFFQKNCFICQTATRFPKINFTNFI